MVNSRRRDFFLPLSLGSKMSGQSFLNKVLKALMTSSELMTSSAITLNVGALLDEPNGWYRLGSKQVSRYLLLATVLEQGRLQRASRGHPITLLKTLREYGLARNGSRLALRG